MNPSRPLKNCVERPIGCPRRLVLFSFERSFALFFSWSASSCAFQRPVQTHDPESLRWNCGGHQVSHAHQVVDRTSEGKHLVHLQRSATPHLAQQRKIFSQPKHSSMRFRFLCVQPFVPIDLIGRGIGREHSIELLNLIRVLNLPHAGRRRFKRRRKTIFAKASLLEARNCNAED